MTPTGQLLDSLRAIVGPGYVDATRQTRHTLSQATFAHDQPPPCAVIAPGSASELAACLAAVSHAAVPVHPVSRGRNWGYGSRLAPVGGAIIADLRRLTRITAFDAERAQITVEPGVSFAQLNRFLAAHAPDLFLTAPGSGEGASVLAHAVQGGIAPGPRPARRDHVLRLDGVTAEGRAMSLRGAAELDADTAPCIYTRATFQLDRRPAYTQAATLEVEHAAELSPIADKISALMTAGVIPTNAAYHAPDKRTQLGESCARPKAWQVAFSLGAKSETALSAQRAAVAMALGDHVAFAKPAAPNPFFGTASGDGLHQAYAAKPPHARYGRNPDADGCGVIWCAAHLPCADDAIEAFVTETGACLAHAGFARALTLHQEGPDALIGLAGVIFDRGSDSGPHSATASDVAALHCARTLIALFHQHGWSLHRTPAHLLGCRAPQARMDDAPALASL